MESKVEELEDLNQALRNRDKMKDDAIVQLSDQIMALTARMQEIEIGSSTQVIYSMLCLTEGFVGGYELDLLLMAISISLLLTGIGSRIHVMF